MKTDEATLFKSAIVQGMHMRYQRERELAEREADFTCTQAHWQRMSEILSFDAQKLQTVRKRKLITAAIFVAAALMIGSLTAYAYRERIREFFVQVFDEYIALNFPGEQAPPTITVLYELGYVPDGYTLATEMVDALGVCYEWTDEESRILIFSQMLLDAEFRMNAEAGSEYVLEHNDLLIYCRQYEDAVSYTWNDGYYILDIYDCAELSEEEILKMIDSVRQQK